MEGFAERLCEHCDIIRVGPATRKMYDDYDYAVVLVRYSENGTGKICGLVAPKLPWWCFWRREFSQLHARAIIRIVRSLGLKETWDRAKKVANDV